MAIFTAVGYDYGAENNHVQCVLLPLGLTPALTVVTFTNEVPLPHILRYPTLGFLRLTSYTDRIHLGQLTSYLSSKHCVSDEVTEQTVDQGV